MATQVKFAVGEIVKLKSGGPEMTVQSLTNTPPDNYFCQWFAGNGEKGTDLFIDLSTRL